MRVLLNHIPLQEQAEKLDKAIGDIMSITPPTDYMYHYVTGITDDIIHPSVTITHALILGAWKTVDFTGFVIYQKLSPFILGTGSHFIHGIVNQTIENCSKGNCF